jgi:hypothetical protein
MLLAVVLPEIFFPVELFRPPFGLHIRRTSNADGVCELMPGPEAEVPAFGDKGDSCNAM